MNNRWQSSPRDCVTVFAPATVANLGPGYDILGLALDSPGDTVSAERRDSPGVTIAWAEEHAPAKEKMKRPPVNDENTAVVAAKCVIERLVAQNQWPASQGLHLMLTKGMPIGSGLGSSGASAVAAAVAANELAGAPLSRHDLIFACAEAERRACGSPHADNVAPGLMGGVVIVRPDQSATSVETKLDLWLALVLQNIELPTRQAREAIPDNIPIADATFNAAHLATLVYSLASNDVSLLSRSVEDRIAEPRRAAMIPNFTLLKQIARTAGSLGISISGAGPSVFALCNGQRAAQTVLQAMTSQLDRLGVQYEGWTSPLGTGARVTDDPETSSRFAA